MKTHVIVTAAFAAFAAVLAGCRSYKPAEPVDWTRKAHLKTPRVTLSSPEDAGRLALVGNPALNALRLKAAGAAAVAEETGWWEDPELDFDLMRIIDPADHPFLGGAGVAFTIPLSGVNKTAKKAAAAYSRAQAEKIKAAEKSLAADAVKTVLALRFNIEKTKTLEAFKNDPGVRRAVKSAERLFEAGEYTLVDLNGVKRQAHAREHMRIRLEDERTELENAFRTIAGLHPGTRIEIAFTVPERARSGIAPPDLISLTSHPAVKAALAELEHSEAELETEIRRQYPDLKIGPLAGNEEGKDRIGVIAGITLPLWNRNRKAIAEAESARDVTRLEAVNVWRRLALDADAAYLRAVRLLDHPPAPAGELKYAEKLLDAGEMSPLEYLTTREDILSQSLEGISWRADVAAAKAEISKFTVETSSNERQQQ